MSSGDSAPDGLRLAAGDWALTAAPERGGAILSLTRAGRAVLRPTPAGADDPLATACFPLVPYANRIGFGVIEWQGRSHRLVPNHPGQAHPLHGVGWLVPWTVAERDDGSVRMRLDHRGDAAWPWRFAAEQRFALAPTGLSVTLDLTNTGGAAMPYSIGLHPCFARADAVRFAASGVWLVDQDMLPTRHAAADALGDWSRGGALARADLVDHCYTGWQGSARIARDDGDVMLTAEGATALHLYVPPGTDFFCAEPVSAIPDAIKRGEAGTLAPGERARIALHIGSG